MLDMNGKIQLNIKFIMARYLGPRLRIVRRFGDLPGLTTKITTKKQAILFYVKK